MKRQLTLTLFILLSFILKAQQNDTAFLILNKVATVYKHQFVHAFEGNEDTCLLELKKFNKNSDIIFHRTDMGCIGWNNTEERFFTYYNDQLQALEIRRDNLPYAKSLFEYDDLNDPIKIATHYSETNDTLVSVNEYYRNSKNRMDSTIARRKNNSGEQSQIKNVYRYDKRKNLVQEYTTDESGTPLSMVSYERLSDGKMKSKAITIYGDNPIFKQIYYEYDQNGRVFSTVDSQNRKQLFFYKKNGLLNNVLTYNGNGALEVEFLFNYTYHE
jgi:hypothetical protein